MAGATAWLVTRGALWGVVILASLGIEATVHGYRARVVAMCAAGLVTGAGAAAVGYGFGLLTLLLVVRVVLIKKKLQRSMNVRSGVAWKYAFPALLLVIVATAGSFVFSLEACEGARPSVCERAFFGRVYTPPQLAPLGKR